MRLEVLGQLKKSNDLIRNRTRDLPVRSIVPQPTTLPRAPMNHKHNEIREELGVRNATVTGNC
jgi:hypothetical protein